MQIQFLIPCMCGNQEAELEVVHRKCMPGNDQSPQYIPKMASPLLWTILCLGLLIKTSRGKLFTCMHAPPAHNRGYCINDYTQLKVVFKGGVEVVCLFFKPTPEILIEIESNVIIKPSSQATSSTVVIKCVGTSQSGGWM